MASQQPIGPLGFDDPSLARASTHDVRAYLLRLILVAALTGVVVAIWTAQNEDTAASAWPVTIRAIDESPYAQSAKSEIIAPAPEQRGSTRPPDTTTLPAVAPQTDEIPRPPEQPEPRRPTEFVRFTIAPADTVFDISIVYGVSIAEILRYNPNLGDGSQVDVGQLIFVPLYDAHEEGAPNE